MIHTPKVRGLQWLNISLCCTNEINYLRAWWRGLWEYSEGRERLVDLMERDSRCGSSADRPLQSQQQSFTVAFGCWSFYLITSTTILSSYLYPLTWLHTKTHTASITRLSTRTWKAALCCLSHCPFVLLTRLSCVPSLSLSPALSVQPSAEKTCIPLKSWGWFFTLWCCCLSLKLDLYSCIKVLLRPQEEAL